MFEVMFIITVIKGDLEPNESVHALFAEHQQCLNISGALEDFYQKVQGTNGVYMEFSCVEKEKK